ncbi:MAG TPA: hypothetical protein VK089_05450, partial [Corynebacterium sp.]|nr:hypothetical protein [Corynebacterium sp.]
FYWRLGSSSGTCSSEPESRAEILRELRTEKPWQDDGGPGFKSRQLHKGRSSLKDERPFYALNWVFLIVSL